MLSLPPFLALGAIMFLPQRGGDLSQSKERHHPSHGDRVDAAVGQHELRRLSHFHGDLAGQVFVFFILTVAAAEAAIGLAILVVLFRNRQTINVDDLNTMKG